MYNCVAEHTRRKHAAFRWASKSLEHYEYCLNIICALVDSYQIPDVYMLCMCMYHLFVQGIVYKCGVFMSACTGTSSISMHFPEAFRLGAVIHVCMCTYTS